MYRRSVLACGLLVWGMVGGCSDDQVSLLALGYPCTTDTECSTGMCYRGTCSKRLRGDNGNGCYVNGECKSYACSGGLCVQGAGKKGDKCVHGEECASTFCSLGECQDVRKDSGVDLAKPDIAQKDMAEADMTADRGLDKAKPDIAPPDKMLPDIPQPDLGLCTKHTDCDDNLLCTTNACTKGVCTYTLQTNYCKVYDSKIKAYTCVADGTADTTNTCLKCDVAKSTSKLSDNDGATCVDTNKCTYNDVCSKGTCAGTAYTCDDKLACTDDACTGLGPGPKGCSSTLKKGSCLIGLVCFKDSQLRDPKKGCQKCDSTKMTYNWTPASGKGCVTTFAGVPGAKGIKDGDATKALFNAPSGIVVDGAGNVYVADTGNHRIRLISRQKSSTGTYTIQVSTWAGGAAGFADGAALTKAAMQGPTDIEMDSTGKVYVVDAGNHAVRVVWNNLINTLAGTGVKGYRDGPVMGAKFRSPSGLAVDDSTAAIKVYVADSGNKRIRRIDVGTGVVSTMAGSKTGGLVDGSLATARFLALYDIERGPSGVLYLTDSNTIRALGGGMVTTITGGAKAAFADGWSNVARFSAPRGLHYSSKKNGIFVADSGNHRIRKVYSGSPAGIDASVPPARDASVAQDGGKPSDASSTTPDASAFNGYAVTTFAGSATSGQVDHQALLAKFNSPYAIAEDSQGNMYIADKDNNVVRLYTP